MCSLQYVTPCPLLHWDKIKPAKFIVCPKPNLTFPFSFCLCLLQLNCIQITWLCQYRDKLALLWEYITACIHCFRFQVLLKFSNKASVSFRLSFLPNRSYSDNGRTILANEQESQDSLGQLWGWIYNGRAVTSSVDSGGPFAILASVMSALWDSLKCMFLLSRAVQRW